MRRLIILLLLVLFAGAPRAAHAQVYLGSSMYFAGYLEEVCGIEFRDGAGVRDPFETLSLRGANIVRAALHFPPYGNAHTSGAPDPDWGSPARVLETLGRAQDHGMATFLTLGYDSYADNGSDRRNPYTAPPAWRSVPGDEAALADSMYAYTHRQLSFLVAGGVVPDFVAIGNEINWRFMEPNVPESSLSNFDAARKVRLLNAAARAVRDIASAQGAPIRIAMHIFSPSNLSWWMGQHRNLDFDVMGMSFYHGWHDMGSFSSWAQMAQWLRSVYGKDLMILETAQLWSSGFSDGHVNILNANENIPPGYPNPPNTQTQRTYMEDITRDLVSGGGLGTIYWGGDWVGSDCFIYPDQYGRGSSWENKAFWDFQNVAHSGMDWLGASYGGTAVEPPQEDSAISLYPNPVRHTAVVDDLPPDARAVTVWTVDGRLLETHSDTGLERLVLSTVTWSPGLTLLRIEHADGRFEYKPLLRVR